MNVYFKLIILISSVLPFLGSCLDNVSESLTLRPLTNGDWFLVLDVSINSKDSRYLFENPEDPYFVMDSMPIDIAKLYLKTKSDWFEANIGFGEWKESIWGDRPEMLITNGLSLIGCWPSLDKKFVYDNFNSLCFGLWGVTGSMFSNLVSEESYIHNVTQLCINDYENNLNLNSTVLLASDFEERACLDVFYKLRMMYPCLSTNGLVSLLGDERLYVRSSYRGINLRVERSNNDLVFKTRVQFTVSKAMLPKTFGGFFPNEKVPRNCLTVTQSTVNVLFPDSVKSQNHNSLTFNFKDSDSVKSLVDKYERLRREFEGGFQLLNSSNEILFEVSELESRYLRVLKRVQSSLLVKITNLSNEDKKLCVHQPLPYWLKPLVHSINLVVEHIADNNVLYKCSAANCFSRNSKTTHNFNVILDCLGPFLPKKYRNYLFRAFDFIDPVPKFPSSDNDPLMIFELGKNWNRFGAYITLPSKSVMYLSVELSKDNITYEDIHLAAHRGQLIPSGVLLDMNNLKLANSLDLSYGFNSLSSYNCHHYYYFLTSFFSQIVLPDNTMIFNVMAAVGAVSALIFGFVFNTLTKDWDKPLVNT